MPSASDVSGAASAEQQKQQDYAIAQLRRSAKSGSVEAMSLLGRHLISGRDGPHEPKEGADLLASAMERGDASAACVMATLSGAGAWAPQSWPKAMELLQLAAERGSKDAREQMVMLADDQALAGKARKGATEPDIWRRLRESVNLEKWVAPPPPVQICEAPRIYTSAHFTTPEVCDWLVSRSKGLLRPSMMFDGQKSNFNATRTCSDFVFDMVSSGVILVLLRIKISLATGQAVPQMEPPQIFHYALGQEIKPHHDFLYDGEHSYGHEGGYQGDRKATFLLYLNDDYEGGDLEFVYPKLKHRGKKGDGIFFASMKDGKPDPQSLHGALPVTKGEKFILSQWIHDRPFTA
jgi:prolyl 4-hydroxylase